MNLLNINKKNNMAIGKPSKIKKEEIKEEIKTFTATSTSKYSSIIQESIDFIYNAKTEKDAVHNTKLLLKNYKKKLTAWELIKLLFKK